MKLRILDRLGVILDMRFWLRIYAVNHKLSDSLEESLDRGEPIYRIDRWTVDIGGVMIWTENFPYGFGHGWPDSAGIPRRRIAIRLRQALKEALPADAPRPIALAYAASPADCSPDDRPLPAPAKGKAA